MGCVVGNGEWGVVVGHDEECASVAAHSLDVFTCKVGERVCMGLCVSM